MKLGFAVAAVLLLTACSSAAPTADPRVQAAAANEADRLDDIAATQERQSQNATFEYERTATALPFAVTALAQERELTQIYVDGKAADAVATQNYRVTESAYSAIVIPTKIAAVGTALHVQSEKDKAELESARSLNNLIGLAALGFLIGLGIGCYWLLGRARADVKRRNVLAEAKPEVVGGVLVLPPGYTSQKIIQAAPDRPALPPPPEIEERNVPTTSNGRHKFITVTQPVNEHDREWRTELVSSAFVFRDHGLASTGLCGKGLPFASATHWKEITDRMADNGLILKDHGETTLPVGEWGDIISRIQDATQPLRLPVYRPPHCRGFATQNVR